MNVYQGDDLITSSVAPTVVTLSSKRGYFRPASYRFEFRRNGFKDNVELDAKFDWWYLGNFILPYGIVWALTVDPLTGAMWKFDADAGVYGQIDCIEENNGPRLVKTSGDFGNGSPGQLQVRARIASPLSRKEVVSAKGGVASSKEELIAVKSNSIPKSKEAKRELDETKKHVTDAQIFVMDNLTLEQ